VVEPKEEKENPWGCKRTKKVEMVVVYGVFQVFFGWDELWVIVGYGRGGLVLGFFFFLLIWCERGVVRKWWFLASLSWCRGLFLLPFFSFSYMKSTFIYRGERRAYKGLASMVYSHWFIWEGSYLLATKQQPGPAKPIYKVDWVKGFRPLFIDFLGDKSAVFQLRVWYIIKS